MHILFVGDVGTISGFSSVSGGLLPRWKAAGHTIACLGVDYTGDPNPIAQLYKVYPAYLGGDYLGVGRLAGIVAREQPDRIVILNDTHVVAQYVATLDPVWHSRILAYIPVDGDGLQPQYVTLLNTIGAVIAYTSRGLTELIAAELSGPLTGVCGHGIDRSIFCPGDQAAARRACGIPNQPFIVLMANRNQPRKAIWLGMQAFAQFLETGADAHLIYHGDVNDHAGGPIEHWAKQFGILSRFHFNKLIKAHQGVSPADLANVYRSADLQITTTRGEGWGLTTMEGMACGVPQVIPAGGSLGEWAAPGAEVIPCYPWVWPHEVGGSLGRVINMESLVQTMIDLWRDRERRLDLGTRGLAYIDNTRFSWDEIAAFFIRILERMEVDSGVTA